jgi:hypothetical protein
VLVILCNLFYFSVRQQAKLHGHSGT